MENNTIRVNALPTLTWHRLHVNACKTEPYTPVKPCTVQAVSENGVAAVSALEPCTDCSAVETGVGRNVDNLFQWGMTVTVPENGSDTLRMEIGSEDGGDCAAFVHVQAEAGSFNYFGTNAKIIQNSYTEDEWNAYYEGKIEPFAIQLSLVMSNMTYTQRELSFGNAITFTANRLQYASNNTKLNISTQLFDRGLLNRNGVMDIWNMSHVEGGDKYYIRKEYAEVSELGKEVTPNASSEGTGIPSNVPAADDPAGDNGEEV